VTTAASPPEDPGPLEKIAAVVAAETGEGFYRALARSVATTLGAAYTFVSELTPERTHFRTLAVWGRGELLDNFTLALEGTPCEAVLAGHAAHHPSDLLKLFPKDTGLVAWRAESYCGVPIVGSDGTVVGHFAVIHDEPMPDGARSLAILRILAMRVRAELERQKAREALAAAEAHYRDLYVRAPVAYITISTDGTIQNLNEQNLKVFGYTREQSIGRAFLDFVPPHAHARAGELFQRALAGADIDEEEVEAIRADGTTFWMRLSARVLRGKTGEIDSFRITFVDVTDRKRAEERLRESEARFRDLYEDAPIAYIAFDAAKRVTRVNRAFFEMTGFADDEVRDRIADDFAPDPEWVRGYDAILDTAERDGFLVAEFPFVRKDGGTRWGRATIRAVRGADGELHGFNSICSDVTELKNAEEALRQSEARFRGLYDEAPVAYFTLSADGRILRANRRAAEFLGLPIEQVVGKGSSDFTSPTSPLVWNAVVERLRAGGRVNDEEVQILDAGGMERWMRFSAESIRDAGGAIGEIRIAGVDVTEGKKTERVSEYLQEEIKSVHNFEEIVGRSPALTEALRKVELVASTESSVLILGETGTGKELFARAIHSRSPRRDRPLIKVNCAALPTGLIESELFGHERGAFTGAAGRRIGRFELANGGTIFLDEIGELPLELQAKLLRVLQDQEFERVGGSVTLQVDVRVIAATNRDLSAAVAQGTFRQDLFYRLNVFPIRVPALRERRGDVPLLVHYFLNRYATKTGRHIELVPKATMDRLASYTWPGNVRELENVIERAVILSAGPALEVATEMVPPAEPSPAVRRIASSSTVAPPAGRALDDVERSHILAVLESCAWRIEGPRGAARELNLSPSSLRRRIQKLGLSDPRAARADLPR
jgi:formate hydrogenlyase transcriptional activator